MFTGCPQVVTSALGESRVRSEDSSLRAQPRDFSKPRRAGSRFLGSSRFDGRTDSMAAPLVASTMMTGSPIQPPPNPSVYAPARGPRSACGNSRPGRFPRPDPRLRRRDNAGDTAGRKKTTRPRRLEKSRRIAWRPSGWRANPPAPATIDPTPAGFLRRAVVLKLAICEVLGLNLREFVCNPGAAGQIIHRHCGSVHRPFQEDGLGITL